MGFTGNEINKLFATVDERCSKFIQMYKTIMKKYSN